MAAIHGGNDEGENHMRKHAVAGVKGGERHGSSQIVMGCSGLAGLRHGVTHRGKHGTRQHLVMSGRVVM